MELSGKDYLIDYVYSSVHKKVERRLYEIYTTDLFYMISTGLGNKPEKRYMDIIPKMGRPKPVKEIKDPEVEAAEIVARIKAGLSGKR